MKKLKLLTIVACAFISHPVLAEGISGNESVDNLRRTIATQRAKISLLNERLDRMAQDYDAKIAAINVILNHTIKKEGDQNYSWIGDRTNLRGPKGDDGEDGIDGKDGMDGVDGQDGSDADFCNRNVFLANHGGQEHIPTSLLGGDWTNRAVFLSGNWGAWETWKIICKN